MHQAVVHMLNGKAVARALRGHFLVENALYALLASSVFGIQLPTEDQETELSHDTNEELDDGAQSEVSPEMIVDSHSDIEETTSSSNSSVSPDQERIAELRGMFEGLMAGNVTVATVCEDELLATISQELEKKKEELKQYPTAALWIQYLDMIQILKTFIKAERTGEWELSLYAVQQMLPYFAAAGHNLHLKSAHVYLQTMCQLRDNNPRVYEAFKKGHHVIRRSDRYWAGLSTDLVIEQVLMRSVKTTGGMTRGKGMSEYQRAQWSLSMPVCAAMNVAMQTFFGTDFHTSSQHKETGKSRIERDNKDSQTFLSFLTERNPFCEGTLLRNIETGVTSDPSVNAYKAVEIGNTILQAMVGKNAFDYSFKKSSQAVTPTTTPTVTLDGETVPLTHNYFSKDLQQQPSDLRKTFHRFLHMNFVVFHPHYLIQLDSSENHKSPPWQMLFGDLETAAVWNHLEMTSNSYLTVALYYNVYHGVKAQPFPLYVTCTLIMSQENTMMLLLFLMVIDLVQLQKIQHTSVALKESLVQKCTLHKILHSKQRRNSFCPTLKTNKSSFSC